MDRQQLQQLIDACHASGKRIAVYFCSHVPQEILLAAGMYALRMPYVHGLKDYALGMLPRNVCPMVKNCCDICESGVLDDVDLIIGETSCDGKKKTYELISAQDKLYFYQVAQGSDRDYVKPLIESECKYLVRHLEKRFGIEITEDAIREAAKLVNEERRSVCELMEIQKQVPTVAWGREIFEVLEENRMIPDIEERIRANREARERFLSQPSSVPRQARRILITGCPIGGVYDKILTAVEKNGGAAVCFENCEVMKSAVRSVDVEAEDIYQALAECYRNTACALMSPNELRLDLIARLVKEYDVDGVIDVTLQTCHPYTVERYKMMRHCREELDIPYMAIETDRGDADKGQLTTRISAFVEMI